MHAAIHLTQLHEGEGGQQFAAAFQQSLTVLTEQIGAECNRP
jgi:hypothetical protein